MTSAPARFSGLHRGPTCMLVKSDNHLYLSGVPRPTAYGRLLTDKDE